jgi:hypothetical protein
MRTVRIAVATATRGPFGKREEALSHQPGARQQNDGERHLRRHEETLEAEP